MFLLNLDKEFRELKITAASQGISEETVGKIFLKAKRGDSDSQLQIANIYLTDHNNDYAFRWFLKSALKGNAEAEYAVSEMIINNGAFTIEDRDGYSSYYDSPEPWLEKAWEHGKIEAAARLAQMYRYAPSPDNEKAAYWYNASYERGGECDSAFLANYLLNEKGDRRGALLHLIIDAKQNNSTSSMLLAAELLSESSDKKDAEKLRELLTNAAESGMLNGSENYIRLAKAHEALGEAREGYNNYKKAFELTDKEADPDTYDFLAQKLGNMLYTGKGVDKDYAEAVKYYEKVKTFTDEEAKKYYAECKFNGLGTEKSLEEAAGLGRPEAIYEMAKANPDREDLLIEAASKGYIPAKYDLGMKYYEEGKFEQAILQLLPTSLEYKDSVPYVLGVCFAKTNKPAEALHWFEISADGSVPEGAYFAGRFYAEGIGTEVNEKKAFEYYKKAAVKGSVDGVYELGMCQKNGIGCPKNTERAMMLIAAAADNGSPAAMFEMGNCKRLGYGTSQSKEEAIKYYKSSAELGYESAAYQLGFLYEVGYITGVNDPKAAITWYEKCRESFKDVKKRLAACRLEISRSGR